METIDLGRFMSVQVDGGNAFLCISGNRVATFTDAETGREFAGFMAATVKSIAASAARPAQPAFTLQTVAAFAGLRPLA